MRHKQKALLLGRGYWGEILARYIQEYYDLLEILGSNVEPSHLYKSLESANVAFIATPLHSHFSLAQLALECNCDVFIEKPTTTTLAQLTTLQSLARKRNRVLFTNYIYTFSRSIGHALELLEQTSIQSIHAKICQYGRFYANESVLEVLGVHYLSVFAAMEAQGILHNVRVVECEFFDSGLQSARVVLESSECPISLECSLLAQSKTRILQIQTNNTTAHNQQSSLEDTDSRDLTLCVNMLSPTPLTIEPSSKHKSLSPLPIYDESQNLILSLDNFTKAIIDKQTYHYHERLCTLTLQLLEQAHAKANIT